jgi:hypothetical protein
MKRKQIFGDASCMGSDAEVTKELADMDAAEAAAEAEEKEAAAAEAECKKLAKRGVKGLMRFD